MMLSDQDILNCIKNGEIRIHPFKEKIVKASGINLHLGEHLLRPEAGKVVDVKNKIVPDYTSIKITSDNPYSLKPGEFVLGHTYENVGIDAKLALLIEGRSTLARVGLTIVQTAMMVYPGHRDRAITLEIANHGCNPILLYPKMKIARAAFFELRTPASELYDDYGKYKEQKIVGPPIF
ncbi:MAG: dCTP deaminase, partial [Candidatus Dadabacteria bacterium]